MSIRDTPGIHFGTLATVRGHRKFLQALAQRKKTCGGTFTWSLLSRKDKDFVGNGKTLTYVLINSVYSCRRIVKTFSLG